VDSLAILVARKDAAPTKLDPEEIKRRNQAALERRKASMAQSEASKPLPEGWRRVESAEVVSAPLVAQSEDSTKKAALKDKNLKALERMRESLKKQKEEENSLPLPEGWKRVESRSRPGEVVFENTVTGERQAWFPTEPAVKPGTVDAKRQELIDKNKKALEARKAKAATDKAAESSKPLPEGWRRVESRSRPGEFVYENIHTEERQAWFPDTPAEKVACAT
jgi:hypothetical protein